MPRRSRARNSVAAPDGEHEHTVQALDIPHTHAEWLRCRRWMRRASAASSAVTGRARQLGQHARHRRRVGCPVIEPKFACYATHSLHKSFHSLITLQPFPSLATIRVEYHFVRYRMLGIYRLSGPN